MKQQAKSTLVWFRQDLRLEDNPALIEAAARGGPVIPVFLWTPQEEGEFAPGGASQWWLHHSLKALDSTLQKLGARLIIRSGSSLSALQRLIEQTGADAVYWNHRYEPATIGREKDIKARLIDQGIEARTFVGSLLIEPWKIATRTGEPYKVFTSFYKAVIARIEVPEPQPAPSSLASPSRWPTSEDLDALGLLPSLGWADGFSAEWTSGSTGALNRLSDIEDKCHRYSDDRDRPDLEGTSRLSPHLHHGEISPRQVFSRLCGASYPRRRTLPKRSEPFLRQLIWREFAHHLLYHFPDTTHRPMRERFNAFAWSDDNRSLRAWQKGQTGYPIVDAGMRQLWATGWMHNRVRMVAASFLTKHLLIDWRVGARWFWDTLVDADLANNTLGWQWVAGCGADAAPYFRIFNPVLQGTRFDPDGHYVRTWVPELADMPAEWIHRPFDAPESALRNAKVSLGDTYPEPIIDHAEARQRALAAYQSIRTVAQMKRMGEAPWRSDSS